MDLLHILPKQLADIPIFAVRRGVHLEKKLVMPNVDHFRFQKIDIFVIDLVNQWVAFRIRRAIDVGPLIFRHRC